MEGFFYSEAKPKPKIKDWSQRQKHWIYLLVVVTLSSTVLPYPEEDYNTVVETSAIKKTSAAELRVGIEETSR